jgi:hypothetical protein
LRLQISDFGFCPQKAAGCSCIRQVNLKSKICNLKSA